MEEELGNTGKYYKSSIKPAGGLFDFRPSGGGLIERGLVREGGSFTKSSDKDIFGNFSTLLSHILQNQHTISRLKYINSTQLLARLLAQTIEN